jgi:DNA polymerase-1
VAAPYAQLWAVDCEFTRDDHKPGPVAPICLCAVEVRTGRTVRLWQDEMAGMVAPPFPIGPDSCLIAYAAGAEAMVFAAMGWPRPAAVVDLFAEFALLSNVMRDKGQSAGRPRPLMQAMRQYRLPFMDGEDKERWRALAINPPAIWSPELKGGMLDYCGEDADADRRLLLAMDAAGHIDWPRAVWRGLASFEFGIIEHNGIPLDCALYRKIVDSRKIMMQRLIARLGLTELYPDGRFNYQRLGRYLARHGIPWPRLASGVLATDKHTLRRMAELYPEQIGPIAELQATRKQLDRPASFPVGPDGRMRFWCHPYGTVTGRNKPRGKDNILAGPAWMRALIQPDPGTAIVFIDYSAQEVAIAAGLSRDANMQADYAGDFHFAVAVAAGLAAPGVTGDAKKRARNRVKPISLGSLYGLGPHGVAAELGVTLEEAEAMLATHHRRYPAYWQMIEHTINQAVSTRRITSGLGWSMQVRGFTRRIGGQTKPVKVRRRALQNWRMQTVGAEMLRAAIAVLGREGFKILTTAHDAIIFEMSLATLDVDIARARDLMERVSLSLTRGVRVKTEATTIRPGERMIEPKAAKVWALIVELIEEVPEASTFVLEAV